MWTRPLLCVLATLCLATAGFAESPKVERTVGEDGVPVITVKGTRATPAAKPVAKPAPPPTPTKSFRVYELDGDATPVEPPKKSEVIVLSPPPPIVPATQPYPYWYYNSYRPGYSYYRHHPSVFSSGSYRYHYSNYRRNQIVNYQNPPINYQNPPINYQNPPINYQNPPINYRPMTPTAPNPSHRWRNWRW